MVYILLHLPRRFTGTIHIQHPTFSLTGPNNVDYVKDSITAVVSIETAIILHQYMVVI